MKGACGRASGPCSCGFTCTPLPRSTSFNRRATRSAGSANRVADGNRKVFAELAPLFARFVEVMAAPPADRPARVDAFLASLKPGASDEGGQDVLQSGIPPLRGGRRGTRRLHQGAADSAGQLPYRAARADPPPGRHQGRDGRADCRDDHGRDWPAAGDPPRVPVPRAAGRHPPDACARPSRTTGSASPRDCRCGSRCPAAACCRSVAITSRGRTRFPRRCGS